MPTQLNLPYVRFIRQVTTQDAPNTQFVALMGQALVRLQGVPWRLADADPDAVNMPLNDPLNFVPSDSYDAFKANKTTAGSGTQRVSLGAVAYRYTIPADAVGAATITAVTLTLGADKFAYSGLRCAAVLSMSPTPPEGWDMIIAGGEGTTPDATGKFAAVDASSEGAFGVLNSHAADRVNDASNASAAYTLDLSAVETNTYTYLYLIVSMFDYTDWRESRQYWVEGAGTLLGSSVAVDFSADVDPDVSSSISVGLRLGGQRKTVVFTAPVSNLTDGYIHRHWAAAMLRRGRVAVSVADPSEVDDDAGIIFAGVNSDGGTVTARGSILSLYVPAAAVRDGFCWLRVSAAQTGVSPVRVSLFNADPDPTKFDTWSGAGAACVGSILIAEATGAESIGIPLRQAVNGDLWAVCCVADVLPADAALPIGWGNAHGLDFADAHISRVRYETTAAPEWVAWSGDASAGLMLPLLCCTSITPTHFALSANGAIYRARSSYPAWVITPVAGAQSWHVSGSGNYVAVLASGAGGTNIGLAGTVASSIQSGVVALVADADADIVTIAAFAALLAVQYLDNSDSTVKLVVYGALSGALSRYSSWAPGNIVALTGGGDILCAQFADGSARIDGLSSALASTAATAVESLTDVAEIRASNTHIIARHNDGTCTAIVNAAKADPTAGVDVSTWSGVVQIAAAKDCVFGRQADGTILRSGITNWIDFTAIDDRGCLMVIGSGYPRVAFKLM